MYVFSIIIIVVLYTNGIKINRYFESCSDCRAVETCVELFEVFKQEDNRIIGITVAGTVIVTAVSKTFRAKYTSPRGNIGTQPVTVETFEIHDILPDNAKQQYRLIKQ